MHCHFNHKINTSLRLCNSIQLFNMLTECFTQTIVFFNSKSICITLNCAEKLTDTLYQSLYIHIHTCTQNLITNIFHAYYTPSATYLIVQTLHHHNILFTYPNLMRSARFLIWYYCYYYLSYITKLLYTTDNYLYTNLVMTIYSIYNIYNG